MAEKTRYEKFSLNVLTLIVSLVFFLPLFIFEYSLFPFVFPRTIAFRILIELAAIVFIPLAVYNKRYRPPLNLLSILVFLFGVLMVLTGFLGVDWYRSFWSSIERVEGILTWAHLYLFFIILTGVFKTWPQWKNLLFTIVIAGSIQAFHNLLQFFNLPFVLHTSGTRIDGTIGNPSFLATYILCIIFIARWLITDTKSKSVKFLLYALIVVDIFMLWNTQTRGAILGFIIGIVVFISFLIWKQRKPALRAMIIFVVGLVVAAGIFLFHQKDADWVKSNLTLHRITSVSFTDATTRDRLIVWDIGLQAFLERSLLGWGVENFQTAFNEHFNPLITRDIGARPWFDRAHNAVIETGVAMGSLGILLYFSALLATILLIKKARWLLVITSEQFGLISAFIVTYAIQAQFVFDTLNSQILLVAIGSLFTYFVYETKRSVAKKPLVEKRIQRHYIMVMVAMILIIIPALYWFNVRPVIAVHYTTQAITKYKLDPVTMRDYFKKSFNFTAPENHELRFILLQHTRDLIGRIEPSPELNDLIRFSVDEMEKSIIAEPHVIQNYLVLAEMYLETGGIYSDNLERAERILREAEKRAPGRYQIFTLLGRVAISKGDFKKSLEYLHQAVSLNENFVESYWNLAIAHILAQRFEEATDILATTEEKGFDIYAEKNVEKLLSAYRDSRNLEATTAYVISLIEKFPDNEKYQELLRTLTDIATTTSETIE